MKANLKIKRIYDLPDKADGFRVLVDRLWPRGISKERAGIGLWLKEIAPTPELRLWFGHDPDRWDEFRRKYIKELNSNTTAVDGIRKLINKHGTTTLLYAAKDQAYNHAIVLKSFLEKKTPLG